ncbi:hypothetical protein [Fibrobacter succinogenes]|uniref:Lipoprotein n=1 Tax=Fibrobacter succinogenes TaxID=833 RepID=A0A380S834_FIBSU|nr:hypothetical protein [Fibrobacter succinogenes]PWJ34837.1 hypothetical protein IE02_2374 [Fibrobacter succinogenes subsp. elongatus]SUQ24960.1 hypothetical protein SAMN05661053_2374 [Fibrobacter succinogenes]
MQGRNLRFSLLMCVCFWLALGSSLSFAAKTVSSSEVSRRQLLMKMKNKDDDMRSFCSGMHKCLDIKYEACTEADLKPWPKISYDEEFCGPYKEIVKRGFPLDIKAPMMTDVFLRLGRQYRAIYSSEGTLPLEVNEISYLFDNMPFTADLINAYLESEYTLEYNSLNRRYFSGSNGHGLSGDFYWALQDSAGTKTMLRNMFFGYGYAQILKWSLKGTAVAFLDMDLVAPRKLKYKLTAVVFPANSVLNSIMQLRVFKSVVNSKIDDVVNDIKKAASMYYGGNRRPLTENAKLRTPENKRHIAEYDKVVAGGSWKLGDAERLERSQMELSKPKPVVKPAEPKEKKESIESSDLKANTFIIKE